MIIVIKLVGTRGGVASFGTKTQGSSTTTTIKAINDVMRWDVRKG